MSYKIVQEDVKNVVRDSLLGLTCVNQETSLFDFGNVLVQKDYFKNGRVRIVSGGSFYFGEFVGKGMLTAAVQGETCIAPPSKIILRALRELSLKHLKGILIIIPAISGDLLNFGVAVERALNDNLKVKLLPVSDDVNNKLPKICKVGLSGAILLNKIAGAMSQNDKPLNDIFEFCQEVIKYIKSYGISLTDSTNEPKLCICRQNELINEPKVKKPRTSRIYIGRDICKTIVDKTLNVYHESDNQSTDILTKDDNKLNLKPEDSVIVLLNNNEGLSKVEQYIFVKEFLSILCDLKIKVERFYLGNFLKCSRSVNLTVTILYVFNSELLGYLDEPCTAPGWIILNQGQNQIKVENFISGNLKRKDRLAPPIQGPKLSEKLANVLLLSTQFACDALISCEKQLNTIDSEGGDGDTGTRLKNASEVLLKRMKNNKVITNYPFTFFESLSKLLEATVGGASGCIYSILFEAAANCFGKLLENEDVTPFMWLNALDQGCEALKRYGNVNIGDGTMLDAIFACASSVREELEAGESFIEAFGKGVSAAEEAAQKTKKMKYPDSGAHSVGIWMRAVYEGVKLRCPVD